MNQSIHFLFIFLLVCILYACNSHKENGMELKVPAFPYQSYLDSIGEDEYFPTIGNI